MTWAANVKTSPAPIKTTFAPIYELLSHPNFTSRFSSAQRYTAEAKIWEALPKYCELLRGNGELDSCTDVPTDSLVTITDAYIEQGISLCPDREVFDCNV